MVLDEQTNKVDPVELVVLEAIKVVMSVTVLGLCAYFIRTKML